MKITEKDLRKQRLLEDLTISERRVLKKIMVPHVVSAGEAVFEENSPTEGIFLIHHGKVEVSISTPDGWRQTVATFARGQFFGELSVIEDRKKHTTRATAVGETTLFLIPVLEFKKIEKTAPQLMAKIMRTMAQVASAKVHAMNERLVHLLISY